jgi:hypothetical protein
MKSTSICSTLLLTLTLLWTHAAAQDGKNKEPKGSGLTVDTVKKTVTIDAKIAPRKLAHLKGETYPIEVIASWAYPKGRKAHETIVTFEVKPSEVHKALETLGLKAGKPILGESKEKVQGPEVNFYIDVPQAGGGTKRLTMDKVLVDPRNGSAFPKNVKFRFTGSIMTQPDPEKDDKVYGADISGTLATIFPVANDVVFQTGYTMADEKLLKLDTNTKNLPPEGTAVKFVIEVAGK